MTERTIVDKLETLEPQYRETVLIIMDELLDILAGDGAGVFFSDTNCDGKMSVHVLGDADVAAGMIAAAPSVYERMYGVPDGTAMQ